MKKLIIAFAAATSLSGCINLENFQQNNPQFQTFEDAGLLPLKNGFH